MRIFVLSIIAVLALVLGFAQPGSAASTVTQTFLLTSPGATPALAFSGQLQCSVQIYGPNPSIASTPQYSANFGVTWDAATAINGGSISQPGVFIGTNPASAGYTSFRLNVQSFTGSQISGQLVCGDSLPSGGGGGSGGVTSLVAGVCTSPVPATGNVAVNYTCATPGPQATPSPSATGCGTVTGLWPYTIDTTACSGGGGGATYQSYDQMVEADHPAQFLPLAANCNDIITANPSWAASGTPTFGSASLTFDGALSTTFGSTGNYCSIPSVNSPAFLENSFTNPFTVAFWFKYTTLPSTGATIFSTVGAGGSDGIEIRVTATTGAVHLVLAGIADEGVMFTAVANTVYYVAVVINPNPFAAGANASRPFWRFYENGAQVASGNDVAVSNNGNIDAFGASNTTGQGGQGVLMQYVEIYYGSILSAPRIMAHYIGGSTGVYN